LLAMAIAIAGAIGKIDVFAMTYRDKRTTNDERRTTKYDDK